MLEIFLNNHFSILTIIVAILGFIFSIGFHEFSHAKSAQMMGDMTPVYQGRVTLNPLAHLDPIGTIMMFIGFFGWGKPVEVNPDNMGANPERKYFISSIVGPISNIFLAAVFFSLSFVLNLLSNSISSPIIPQIILAFEFCFVINIILAIFNLIPIPPLDGSKIWSVILPYNIRTKVEPLMNRYSIIFILILILPIIPTGSGTVSLSSIIISPIINFISTNILGLIK